MNADLLRRLFLFHITRFLVILKNVMEEEKLFGEVKINLHGSCR